MSKSIKNEKDNLTNLAPPPTSNTLIPGLSFIDDNTLHSSFRRLKGNQMYFVDRCNYYETNLSKSEMRIIALTPGALFVVDFNGATDRVTPFDHITDLYFKKIKDKKLVSFSPIEFHLLFKIPTEMDCHVSFASSTIYEKFSSVILTILQHKRNSHVVIKDIPPNKDVEYFFSDKRPEGYYTPREITEINRQRNLLLPIMQNTREEIAELYEQVQRGRTQLTSRANELEILKQKGIDEESIRQRKLNVEEMQMRLHRKVAEMHEKCERVQKSIKTLQDQLTGFSGNNINSNSNEALIEKGVEEAMIKVNKKHEDTVSLRRRMQQKEKSAIEEEIAKYKQILSHNSNGANAKVKSLETQFHNSFGELEKELEAVFRLEKFLATINGEVESHSDQINVLNGEKKNLMKLYEKKNIKSPTNIIPELGERVINDDPLLISPPTAPIGVEDLLGSPPGATEDDLL